MARVGVLAVALVLLIAADASAATRTWDGGCGADTKWSCAANWSENTVPGGADTATFNTTSTGNSTVDAGFAGVVGGVAINAGYTGTISLSKSLSVIGNFSQAAGSFNAGSQALSLKSVMLTAGTFTASSGTTSISGNLKITKGVFQANGGTLSFNGGGGTLNCGSATFNLVTFTNTSGIKSVNANCTMPLGKDPKADSGGSITLNGVLSGSGTLTTAGTLTLGVTGELSGFTGLLARNLTVKGSYDFDAYEPFDVSGPFIVKPEGFFRAPSGAASFGKNFTVASESIFDPNEGTIVFDSPTTFKVSCGGKTLENVSFESKGHKTIAGDCDLPLGEDPSLGTAGGTTLNGSISGNGTLTQIGTFTIGSDSPGLDSFTDVVDEGSFLVSAGAAVTAPSGTLTVQGNFSLGSGATFDHNEGTVNFQAVPKTTKTIACGEAEFNLVEFTNTSKQVVGADCVLPLGANPKIGNGGQIVVNGELTGSGTLTTNSLLLTLGSTGDLSGFPTLLSGALLVEGTHDFSAYEGLVVGGDFTIAAGGSFIALEGPATFNGDFVNRGEFDANDGMVKLAGADQFVGGDTTFYGLSDTSSGGTDTFEAGSTQTVEGTLMLDGGAKLLSAVSSKPGTPWLIDVTGSQLVKHVEVSDSASIGAEIVATESVDAGGNTGWSFP